MNSDTTFSSCWSVLAASETGCTRTAAGAATSSDNTSWTTIAGTTGVTDDEESTVGGFPSDIIGN